VTRRIAIVLGPTAGHVYPGLAIADAYRAEFPAVDTLFVGAPDGPAAPLLAARGLRLETVSGSPIAGVGAGGKLAALSRVPATVAQARRLLRAHGARLAIGVGGYVSGGVLIAARSLGLRTVIHEANVVPGLANRLLTPIAHRVHLGFASAAPAFPARRSVLTGNPVRREIAALAATAPAPPAPERAVRIFVTGGSRGGRFLAARVPALLAAVERRGPVVEVLHQAGEIDAEAVRDAYRAAGVKASVATFFDDVADVYRWAHFVVARAGAGTIAELAAAALPALLVPLAAAAGDHQADNARGFAAAGAGLWTRETDWDIPALAAPVAALLADARAWRAASAAARTLAVPDAAARVVADCERLMAGRW
jgi:UDP-N-acetylglucosamine--N-acetylmuramyl-(pentapeptide) pyrophosphoryl-undecaprenol N-acetylglucosamine transferase